MTQHPSRQPRSRRRGIGFAVLATFALAASVFSSSAIASPGSGKVVLSLSASGGNSSLPAQGVKLSYSAKAGKTGATKSAAHRGKGSGGSQKGVLTVVDLELLQGASIRTAGALKLSSDKRRAVLQEINLQSSGEGTAVSAKLGDRRLVFFRARGGAEIGKSSATLSKAPLSLTGKGADALRRRLGLDSLSAGQTGNLSFDADQLFAGMPKQAQPETKQPSAPDEPDPGPPYPYEAECPVGNVDGPPGFGNAPGEVAGIVAAPTFNPGTSQDLSGSSIEWGFKDSFRNYVGNVPPVGSLQALDGAGTNPAGPSMATAGSFFDFPLTEGTYEAGSSPDHSGDKLVAEGAGTTLFCKSGHGFNIVLKDPTVTIDGEDSRITADIGMNLKGTWYPFQRADIAGLDLSGITPTIDGGGSTIAWEDVPAKLTADGAAASGGLYAAGTVLDTITVKTTLGVRPLLDACTVAAGAGTPPTVDFTQAALPTLTSPVELSGDGLGTIDWGFRRSLRASVAASGSFQLLGGASEGYPGAMGGGAAPAPGGGLGKFFRFPVSSYAYEAGSEDPGDERLIATSEATVGFCNPNAGNYGVVLSKPTLVIDGANSRLIANAYSFRGPAAGWAGGRVDLVDLDSSAVEAITGAGAVKWGDIPADNSPLESGIPVEGGLLTNALSLANLVQGAGSGGFDPLSARIKLPPEPYPYETECAVPSAEGPPGFGEAPGEVAGIAPVPTFETGVSQDVTGSSIEWGFKDSFRGYVFNAPPSGSLQALDGAGANPAGANMGVAGSFFDFPVADGAYQVGSEPDHSDDKLVAEGSGTALLCKPGHGFDVALKNPTVVIDGEGSRIVADVAANLNGTWYPYQRADIAELDLGAVEPTISDGGNTVVWEDVPATMTADGSTALGLYQAGEPLDTITVRTSLERPMLTQCPIAAGAGAPPAVDFTLAALPTLSSPVTGTGGTIDWGFRRSLRASVAASGSFQLLGGASEGYPGAMGGGAAPAPGGGLGKFFRFPVSSYAYEAGSEDPGDERLIATSEATVGFCNPNAGNYGVVLSKPTLVIDGANSRLIANAYSFRGPAAGWAGGRVDLVDLDTSGTVAVADPGTVRWGDIPADNNPVENGIPVEGGFLTNALSPANLAQGAGTGGFDPVTAQIALPTP